LLAESLGHLNLGTRFFKTVGPCLTIPPAQHMTASGVRVPTKGRKLSSCIRHRGSPRCPAAVGDTGATCDPAAENLFGKTAIPSIGATILALQESIGILRVFESCAERE
jgi:hypothetical protein